jgi:acetyl-CoA acetyltransferase
MDDYYNARMVTTPFGLYDCDVPCDGAIAVVVSALETTKDLAKEPVLVEAVGTQVLERLSWDQETLTHMPQALGPSAHLWTRTSLTPDDVDAAMLYDGFTFNALSWLEGLGFCEFGEASDYIGDGSTIALGGRLPLNPHGGQLSAGRLAANLQDRFADEAVAVQPAGRQVDNCRVVVASAGGGVPSGVMLLRKAE